MARILVTGGTGYIGSHTTVELMQQGYDVTIVDNLSNSSIDVIDGIAAIVGRRPEFANIDCGNFVDLDNVFKTYPDIVGVIHFAASKAVGESVEKPLLYYRNNIGSLVTLLEVMAEHDVSNIVFSSSCTVYGQPDANHLPVDETAPIQKALSPYGNTKQINEEIICDQAHANKGLHATILRYFNPIGAHPSALIGELPNGVPQNLLPFIT
jgi:UDP-glucose 4-epimerase